MEKVWDFYYRLESYVPKAKREYGYFVLPILHRGQIIARMDTKAWRKKKKYEIKALYIEPNIAWTDAITEAVRKAVWEFARWQNLETVTVTAVQPEKKLGVIKEAFESPLS